MSSLRHLLHLLLLGLVLAGCRNQGRVHEVPPPSYPESESVEPRPAPAEPPAPAPDDWLPDPGYAEPPSPPPAEAEARADRAPQASRQAAPAARGAEKSARSWSGRDPAPEPRQRPGLATHWGETRYSPARQVEFERAHFRQPAVLCELHYNDRAGALRMLPGGSWGKSEVSVLGGAVEIRMVDASGRAFPAMRRGSRVVSMGDPGERYALLIENRSPERFEVVATVDGLDVLDGEDGAPEKRGYLVGAYSSVMIDGFRRSDDTVAAFRLGDVARSYANGKGKARNVGVIGFALFDERKPAPPHYAQPPYPEPWYGDDTRLRRTADPFPGGYAQPPRR